MKDDLLIFGLPTYEVLLLISYPPRTKQIKQKIHSLT